MTYGSDNQTGRARATGSLVSLVRRRGWTSSGGIEDIGVEGALWSQAAAHGRSNYYQQRDCKLPKSCQG